MREVLISMNNTLKNICSVSSGFEGDRFVGIRFYDGVPEVHFPLGFSMSDDEKELRNDICLLIKILKKFGYRDKQMGTTIFTDDISESLPLSAYQRMIQRYLDYGNYTEHETIYKEAKKGRINWSRTIKNIKPMIQGNNAVYTDFIVRDSNIKEHTLIAEIFQYCVYISFERIGWIYSNRTFVKPRIKYNQKLFLNAIAEKLSVTYSDKDKELLTDMATIIKETGDDKDIKKNYSYGTFEFEYVWEKLIDFAYGIQNKSDYFPKTSWYIKDSKQSKENHCLEPDTIMCDKDYIFVLDAKYYRYGVTKYPGHLPDTSSIQKQITYGEFIHMNKGISADRIYNAFLLPANLTPCLTETETSHLSYLGMAMSDWKQNNRPYEKVAGILVDTKFLMGNHTNRALLKGEMSKTILDNIDDRRNNNG